MGENNRLAAQKVYQTMCAALTEMEWNYDKADDDLKVEYMVTGDDLDMHYTITIHSESQRILVCSEMPTIFGLDRRMEAAVAVNAVNGILADGRFLLNLQTGRLAFAMSTSFQDADIEKGMFPYLVSFSTDAVDAYNDRFEKLNLGAMSLAEFLQTISG